MKDTRYIFMGIKRNKGERKDYNTSIEFMYYFDIFI